MRDSPAVIAHVRRQARACADLGSPLYATLLGLVADDLGAGGPSADVLGGYEGQPDADALALRLMGGLHRLVLQRRAPALAVLYPSVGGRGDPSTALPVLRAVLAENQEELRDALRQAPQTNEVGRAAALVGGLLHVTSRTGLPVRLVEIGASAGLNLRADRFRIEAGPGVAVGPADSPVRLRESWRGRRPPDGAIDIVERRGCDVSPVDVTTTDGRLLLTSYVWADQTQRLARLRGALRLAVDVPARVERQGAAEFLDDLRLAAGAVTVVWHSVMWQYLGTEAARVARRIEALGEQASPARPFAHLSLEPTDGVFRVTLRTWPEGGETVLGTAEPHGLPTTWA